VLYKHSRIADERYSPRHGTNSSQHKESSMLGIITAYRVGTDFNQFGAEINDRRTFVDTAINLLFRYKQRIPLPSEYLSIS
jgi:hypothetical protein